MDLLTTCIVLDCCYSRKLATLLFARMCKLSQYRLVYRRAARPIVCVRHHALYIVPWHAGAVGCDYCECIPVNYGER
jgi:hypothetical protein